MPNTLASHQTIVGRFAPSPTGPLHFGSLIAATASYLYCKQTANSRWLLRIEDLDQQRSHTQYTDSIIKTLETYGFQWDGEIAFQSKRSAYYQQALNSISESIFPCSCTRKYLSSRVTKASKYGYVYPGICRSGLNDKNSEHISYRVKTNNEIICFSDQIQERFCQNIAKDVGDFIVKRSDGAFAYQLAVVVDDQLQGINQVIRGADLYDNTPRQIFLQKLLGYDTPEYAHVPVAVGPDGKKLSKQNLAPELDKKQRRFHINEALNFLGQKTMDVSDFSCLDDLWQYAIENWDPSLIEMKLTKPYIPLQNQSLI